MQAQHSETFISELIGRDPDKQGQRSTTGTLGERNLFTVRSVTMSPKPFSEPEHHGERSTPRHIVVVDFEKVAADFKENKVC